MGIRVYKPTTPGRRGMTAVTTEELSKKRPEKSLDVIPSSVPAAGTTMGGRLYASVEAGINGSIERSISGATRPEFPAIVGP